MKKMVCFIIIAGMYFISAREVTSPGYAQCGGIGWTGPTKCTAGFTCTVQSNYFWQCLPAPN